MKTIILTFRLLAFVCILLITSNAGAQFRYLTDTSLKTLSDVQAAFDQDWQKMFGDSTKPGLRIPIPTEEPDITYKFNKREKKFVQFKRWEEFVAPRVYPSGDLSLVNSTYDNYMAFQKNGSRRRIAATGNVWTFVGPPGTSDGGRNSGRMNYIRIDPVNTNIMYAGSPAGGVWKTTDGGAVWKPITDHLPLIGSSDLAIDPTNTNILYLLTGDSDGGSTRSIGVLKSTDGGVTWVETGLKWNANQGKNMSRILINPSNPQVVMVFGADGVYRTTNGGTNWTQTLTGSGNLRDAELKPNDPNIVYAASNRLYRSTNGGASFTQITNGFPASDVGRICMDVTPANPNYVYLFVAKANGDFNGVYRSEDAGLSFTLRTTTTPPNVLGYNQDMGSGNQTSYDMAFTACKANAELLIGAGVRAWRSSDGGATWTVATVDCQNSRLEMHWDIHYLEFQPGSTTVAFATNDGGVYKTINAGTCWSAINQNNISVNQIYGFGIASDNPEIMISGHQDGATLVHTNAAYRMVIGGDGFQCFIDRTNSQVMYGELYYGGFCRSLDGGRTWTNIADNPGLAGLDGAWNTPWCQDPAAANSLWAGYDQVFKSTDRGNNWTQVGTIAGSGKMVDVKVAPSNTNVVYAARRNQLYITQNNGGTWTSISAGLPVSQAAITRIAISDKDPLRAWVTFSGYTSGQKIYQTINGGTSWTNISSGLPNLPTNCVTYVTGTSTNEIYAGCDVGVYYKNDNLASWIAYFDGLPNTIVNDIKIYKPLNQLRVATYGRGIWKAPLYTPGSTVCDATITAGGATTVCSGGSVTLTANQGTSYIWKNGAVQAGTTQTYAATASGSYTVQVTFSNGCTATSAATVVTVNNTPAAPGVNTPVTYCQNASSVALTASGSNLKWYTASSGGNALTAAPVPSTSSSGNTTYYVSQTVSECESPRTALQVVVNATPAAPLVTSPVTYAQGETAAPLTANGTSLKWYAASSGGNSTSSAPVPVTSSPGSFSYYVSQTINQCESPRAVIVMNVTAPAGFALQAEKACSVDGVVNETTNGGFKGTGYVNTVNAVSADVLWAVHSSADQTVTVSIRYANGGTVNRPMALSVNGLPTGTVVDFPSTGAFTTWSSSTASLPLVNGANYIQLSSTTSDGGPNLDELFFNTLSVSEGDCSPVLAISSGSSSSYKAVVSPNPSRHSFELKLMTEATSVTISNVHGAQVFSSGKISKGSLIHFGEGFAPGVYHVLIRYTDGTSEVKKIEKAQ